MKARVSSLAALAIAGTVCLAASEVGAQPFGRAMGQRMSEVIQVREERRDNRREERGRGNERGGQGERSERGEGRGNYRAQPYAPAPTPRGYAYPEPAPGYRYQQAAPPPQAYAPPPAYAQPRAYGYAPAPNSLGSGWRPQQPEVRRGVREGTMKPLGDVMANIQRTTRGRMLDAAVEPGPDGRPTYRVRWAATGGRRIDFIVDAATGAIIGQSGY
jgi:hypothetical protein